MDLSTENMIQALEAALREAGALAANYSFSILGAVILLVVGLIVNSMQDAHHEEDAANTDAYRDEVLARLDRHLERLLTER